MKRFLVTALLLSSSAVFAAGPHKIEWHTEKVGEAVHWMPATQTVKAGETVQITLKHDLEGGFDFHGFALDALKITKQVNRHKPEVITLKIPADLKPGEYPVRCQFHPKHVGAKLIVQ